MDNQQTNNFRNEIIKAHIWIRENNHTIPDDVLDFMKESSLMVLERIAEVKEGSWDYFIKEKIMKCKCGFKFAGPGEYRNCDAYRDKDGQWWIVCPQCGREYRSN